MCGLRSAVILAGLFLLGAVAQADERAQRDLAPADLESLRGEDRLDLLVSLVEEYRRRSPEQALAFGQQALDLLDEFPDPRTEVDVLNGMAWAELVRGEFSAALEYTRESEASALEADYRKGLARSLSHRGVVHWYQGSYDEALDLYERALDQREAIGDRQGIAESLNNLGILHSFRGEPDRALEKYLRSLRIKEQTGDRQGVANTSHNIAEIYFSLGDLEMALDYFERSLVIHEELANPVGISAALDSIGRVEVQRGEYAQAEQTLRRSLAAASSADHRAGVAAALFSLGEALLELSRLEEARENLRRAVQISSEIGDRRNEALARVALATIERSQGRIEEGLEEVRRSIDIAEEADLKLVLKEALLEASLIESARGQHEKALEDFKRHKKLEDEIFGGQHRGRIATLRREYEAEREEREIALLRQQNQIAALELEHRRGERNLLGALVMILLLLGLSLFLRFRERRDFARALEQKKDQLEKTHQVVQSINSETRFERLLEEILEQVQVIEGVEKGIILVRDHATRVFRVRAALGESLEALTHLELSRREVEMRYLHDALQIHPGIFCIRRVAGRLAEAKVTAHAQQLPKAMLAMMIEPRGRLEGVMVLDNYSTEDAFLDSDVDLVRGLKGHVTWAFLKARLLTELRDLNAKKSEILSIAAHDIRSPLSSMMSFLELTAIKIRNGSFDREESLERIERQLREGRATLELMERLLDLSSIEAGVGAGRCEPVVVSDVLTHSEAIHRPLAENKGIELSWSDDSGEARIRADPLRLKQVVDNLVSNAIKYTYAGGQVTVLTRAERGEVVTEVRDSGQGLGPEDLEQVFRSFKRLSARPTGGETSTGLGLAIAKSIVEMYGGSIWVESVKGEGATFSFSLPLHHS